MSIDRRNEVSFVSSNVLQAIERLAATAPAVALILGDFREEWASEEGPPPWYIAMGELAYHLVESYERGATEAFPQLFEAIEELLETVDSEVDQLIAVGLFEALQTISSHRSFSSAVFEQWLGPRSRRAWNESDAGMGEVEAWLNRTYRRHWWQFWRPRYPGAKFTAKQLDSIENPKLKRLIEVDVRRRR